MPWTSNHSPLSYTTFAALTTSPAPSPAVKTQVPCEWRHFSSINCFGISGGEIGASPCLSATTSMSRKGQRPTHLAELTRLIFRHGCQLSSTAAGPSDDNPQCLFIFIDGLDEGSGKGNKGIDRILGVFQDRETELPLGCKIWVSSRETFPLRQYVDGWPSITADDMSEASVGSFLNAAVPDLGKQLGVGREIKGKPREHPHPPSPTRLALSPLQDQGPKRKLTWRSGGMGVGEAPQQIKRKFPVRQVDG